MNYRDPSLTIGSIIAFNPLASEILDQAGIDFCCGGHRLLNEVIASQDIDASWLYQLLEEAEVRRKQSYLGHDFTSMSPNVLSAYIEDTHHAYLRTALPDISSILARVLRAHGKHHPELFTIYQLFGQLKTELEAHLLKEETMLFPILSDGDDPSIRSLTKEIIEEHETAGSILQKLRHFTNHYQVPSDGCPTYAKAYHELQKLEHDLHQHIHLENNILLSSYDPRRTA